MWASMRCFLLMIDRPYREIAFEGLEGLLDPDELEIMVP